MGRVSWIKISVDMFEHRKIKYIRNLPEGNDLLLCWIMLLTICGKCNAGGYVFLTENVPYDCEMLSSEFDLPHNTVKLALVTFEKLNMISIDEDGIYVEGWEEYQSIEGLEKIREQTRKRVSEHRANKLVTSNVTVTQCNATEENRIDKEEDKIQPRSVVEKYHEILPQLRSVRKVTNKRRGSINARLKDIGYDDIIKAFHITSETPFLLGDNDRRWKADFDWLMNEQNITKVLEEKYERKTNSVNVPDFI